MYIKLIILVIGICFSSAFANIDVAGPNTLSIDAEKLYKKNCRICHGGKGRLGIGGASDLSKSTLDVSEAIKIISNGKGGMTPFSEILSKKEIKEVAKYIQSLKK